MGRQKGQSQRSKGNVRPSSSSRAATLLAENRRFVGFDSMSGDLGYVPMLKSLEDDIDATHIDPDFRVALNKMTKKDVTTKTKALTEFSQLCQNKPVQDTVAILSYWPRIYNKLCDDSDRKVREFCQTAFTHLVAAVNKEIAPHLKSIMGCWWMAQSDSYAPTSSAASKAFCAAFPFTEKQKKALLFCQREIIQSIHYIIFVKHATSADINDAFELERKQSMALNAFAAFLRTFDADDISKVSADSVESICLDSKFWKIAKLKSPVIRASFYSVVAAICSCIPNLVTSQLGTMAKCVFHKLDESNPLVLKSLCEAANNLTETFNQWHEFIDIRKGFLPQLWCLIKHGFYGSSKIIGSYISNVLKHFPSSLTVYPVFVELLKCFQVGLQSDKILKSPVETKSFLSTFIACVDVVFLQAFSLSATDTTDIVNLIWTEHLFPLLKSSLFERNYYFLPSLHNAFAQYLKNWSVNAFESEYSDCYGKTCTVIWNDLTKTGKDIVSKQGDRNDYEDCFLAYQHLLMAIKKAVLVSKAAANFTNPKNVKFRENSSDELVGNFVHENPPCALDMNLSLLHDSMEECVKECIHQVLQCKLDPSWLAFVLSSFLKKFASLSLFTLFSEPTSQKDVDYALFFLEQSVLPWVRTLTFSEASKEQALNIACIIYHVVIFCKSSVPQVFENIYSEFDKGSSSQMCLFLSRFLIEDDGKNVTSKCKWFLNFFVHIVNHLDSIQSSDLKEETWQILRLAFSKNATLKEEEALIVLESLNKFLDQNVTLSNVIEVNRIYSTCFANYADCEIVMKMESRNFRFALLELIKFLCHDPQEVLEKSLKSTISILLKTCYYSDSVQTKEFVSSVCSECAFFIASLTFKETADSLSFQGFNRAIVIIAEELVMHHMKQSFIVEWLNALLPDQEQWCMLRPSLDSEVWSDLDSLNKEFGSKNANEVVKDSYFSTVQAYSNAALELSIVFSEAYSNITQHLKYQTLLVETVFARAIFRSNTVFDCDTSLLKPELIFTVLSQVLPNAVSVGNGWLITFVQLIESLSFEHWNDNFFTTTIFRDDPPLNASLAQVLIVFIKQSSSLPHLLTITQWSLRKFLDNHIDFVENVEDAELTTEALAVLVVLLRKVYSLQGNKQIKLDGDESSLPVHLQLFEKIIEWKSSFPSLFLFDVDLLQASDKQVRLNSAIIKFLQCVVDIYSFNIATDQWDFIECSFVSWMESCSSLRDRERSCSVALEFLHSICSLMLSLDSFISSPAALSDPTLPSSLNSEWSEFFKPAAHSSLILVYKAVNDSTNASFQRLLPIIGRCLSSITSVSLLSCSTSFETRLMPGSFLPNEVQTLLHYLCSRLCPKNTTEISANQTIAFTLINKLMDQIFSEDRNMEPPKHLLQVLDKIAPEVSIFIDSQDSRDDPKPFKSQSMKAYDNESDNSDDNDFTEYGQEDEGVKTNVLEYDNAYFYAFLLTWKLLINLIKHCPSPKKSEYIAILVKDPSVDITELLSFVSFLLPDNPYISASEMNSRKVDMFTEELNVHNSWSNSVKIRHLICSLYKDLLRSFPVDVRLWFNNLSKNDRANVADYTSRHVTQVICREELNTISSCKPPSGLTVLVRKVTREVIATYEVSDTNFEIVVQLPANFPLSPVQVNTIQKVGVAPSQWRYWMLQMTMLLHRQNGNILDALLLWKQKVDKKLDGLEECMICFSIVHGTNARSLPKLQCRTCRKKYHAECLYKWFDTSNQSTCPLCRSPMMFK